MSNNFRTKREFINKEKKISKIHYKFALGFMLLFVVQNFFEYQTIGHDKRYTLYIIALPTIFGIFILSYYRRNFIKTKLAASKGFVVKLVTVVFYLIQGILFSYLSLGLAAKTTWNYYNKQIAEQNPVEIINCNILNFTVAHGGRSRNHIYFQYKGELQSFIVDYQSIKSYLDKKISDYKLEITAQKGLWNYYVVNNWSIINN